MDYKNTLNLPKTDFPMKGNLPHKEPEILKYWNNLSIYEKCLKNTKNHKKYILHDGPPYANGDIHIGHAVNKILKDFIIKSKIISGYNVPFIPGWDCHGLPIELQVEKKYGKGKFKDNPKGFIKACREFAKQQIEKQKVDFIRLGIFADWENPYSSMDKKIESGIVSSLGKMISNKHIYYGSKPVHWCIESSSALAEAEVEYKDIVSRAVCVTFRFDDRDVFKKMNLNPQKDIFIPIWTTTPWTLPANKAVAVSINIDYSIVETDKNYLIIAENLVSDILKKSKISKFERINNIKGKLLEKCNLQHPFYNQLVPIILANHVTDENGTGAVHIAPGHGVDDYIAGVNNNLEIFNPVDDFGKFHKELPIFGGIPIRESNHEIIKCLENNNRLLYAEDYSHSYPHCWRYKTPLIFRATPQWFMSMDKLNLRTSIIKGISKIKWLPSWGKDRIHNMIENRPDWCLSRQRFWGVPIPLFLHKDTCELHPDTEKILAKASNIIAEGNIESWLDYDKSEIVSNIECYNEVKDTLDVWFDSGVTHETVLKSKGIKEKADLYLEGSDQHRGWFQSSLITSHALSGDSPYKNVLTHGFVVDSDGQKMSKSLGNIVSPQAVIKDKGADILRLWVAMTDYSKEMNISDEILNRVAESYRRIRNTSKFLLANINGLDHENLIEDKEMVLLDKWIIFKAKKLDEQIRDDYENFKFHKITQDIMNFCTLELGGYYLDIIKDRLYTSKKDGLARKSAQKACYILIKYINLWIAPILTFTSEEIHKRMPESKESIYLSSWFDLSINITNDEIELFNKIYSIRSFVSKKIEDCRNSNEIGSSLEGRVDIICNKSLYKDIENLSDELKFIFIVSECHIQHKENEDFDSTIDGYKFTVKVSKSLNSKCERCWHLNETVGKDDKHPSICKRCIDNISGSGEKRIFA